MTKSPTALSSLRIAVFCFTTRAKTDSPTYTVRRLIAAPGHPYQLEERVQNALGESTWVASIQQSWALGLVLKYIAGALVGGCDLSAQSKDRAWMLDQKLVVSDRENYIEVDLGIIDLDA